MLKFSRSFLVKRIFRFEKTYLTLKHIYMPSNIFVMTEFYFQKVVVSCHRPSTGILSCLKDSLSASPSSWHSFGYRGFILLLFFFLNLLIHIVSLNFSSSFKELPDLFLSFAVTTANDHQLSNLLPRATLNNAGILSLDLVSHACCYSTAFIMHPSASSIPAPAHRPPPSVIPPNSSTGN